MTFNDNEKEISYLSKLARCISDMGYVLSGELVLDLQPGGGGDQRVLLRGGVLHIYISTCLPIYLHIYISTYISTFLHIYTSQCAGAVLRAGVPGPPPAARPRGAVARGGQVPARGGAAAGGRPGHRPRGAHLHRGIVLHMIHRFHNHGEGP